MTQAQARSLLRDVARNAGDSSEYSDTAIDRAVHMAGDDFIHFTGVTEQTSDLAITSGSSAVTLAGVVGFDTERIKRAWIPAQGKLKVIDHADLLDMQVGAAQSGVPTFLAFTSKTGVGEVYATPDAAYTGKVLWKPPFGQVSAGAFVPLVWAAAGTTVTLNIGDDDLMQIINYGATAFLQHNEKQHAYAEKSWAKYLDYRARRQSAGSLGDQTVKRLTLRDLERCRTSED